MAETIAEIKTAMQAELEADAVLGSAGSDPLTSTSAVAVYNEWLDLTAFVMASLENLFDDHVSEVQALIAQDKAHTPAWYAEKAMAFQFGDALPAGSDVYDPVAVAGDASLVVTYAVAHEVDNGVRLKVAGGTVGALNALIGGIMTALTAYYEDQQNGIKDAGVVLFITTGGGDNLQISYVIYYDPRLLNNLGQRLDGSSNTPVVDAINAYLFGLSFETDVVTGANKPVDLPFDLNKFNDAITGVVGVVTVKAVVVQANHAAVPYTDILAASPQQYVADTGYLVLDSVYFNGNVSYQPY